MLLRDPEGIGKITLPNSKPYPTKDERRKWWNAMSREDQRLYVEYVQKRKHEGLTVTFAEYKAERMNLALDRELDAIVRR